MKAPVSDAGEMVATMEPELHSEPYRFVVQNRADGVIARFEKTFAVIREAEGTTFVVKSSETEETGHEGPDFARITLNVHSALEGVGLTAAVSASLAEAGIACNVIAGFHHDHLFVPWEKRDEALEILKGVSAAARD